MIEDIVREAEEILKSETGLSVDRSTLKLYSPEQWEEFCNCNGFIRDSLGIYVPETLTAYVAKSNRFLIPTIYHELLGHGSFCEHSVYGNELISTPKKEMTEEEREVYEGYALWVEDLLCKQTGREEEWEEKKKRLPPSYNQLIAHFKEAEKQMTRRIFLEQLGFLS